MEKLRLLAVTGGVPRYLEQIDPKSSAEENIRRLCFQPKAPYSVPMDASTSSMRSSTTRACIWWKTCERLLRSTADEQLE
jgi:hypothetical protein